MKQNTRIIKNYCPTYTAEGPARSTISLVFNCSNTTFSSPVYGICDWHIFSSENIIQILIFTHFVLVNIIEELFRSQIREFVYSLGIAYFSHMVTFVMIFNFLQIFGKYMETFFTLYGTFVGFYESFL